VVVFNSRIRVFVGSIGFLRLVAEFIWFYRLHFKLVVMVDWWWSVSEVRAA